MARKYEFDEIVEELMQKGEGVTNLLRDMKDISELMVDLAYSAVLFNNDELANEVKDLEEEMNKLRYQVEIRTMLAAKNPTQATKLAGILKFASAAENISNAAERLSEIVLRDVEIHPAVREAIIRARGAVEMVEVKRGSKLVGKTIRDMRKIVRGVNLLAMKKNGSWVIRPTDKEKITSNDHLIATGTRESVAQLRELSR